MSEPKLLPMLPLVSPPSVLHTRWWSCYSCRRNSPAIDCHCAVDLRLVRVAWLRVELWMRVVLGPITTATPCTSSRSSLVGRNTLAISRPAPTSWRRSRQSPRTPGRRMWDRPTYKYGDIWVPTHSYLNYFQSINWSTSTCCLFVCLFKFWPGSPAPQS